MRAGEVCLDGGADGLTAEVGGFEAGLIARCSVPVLEGVRVFGAEEWVVAFCEGFWSGGGGGDGGEAGGSIL